MTGQPDHGRPDRVRKARFESRLSCGCYVRVGEPIARVNSSWRCLACVQRARKIIAQIMQEPPRPGRGDHDNEGNTP